MCINLKHSHHCANSISCSAMLNEHLKRLLADEPAPVELGEWWKVIVPSLDSTRNFVIWNAFCIDHESIASSLLKEYSWELIDHLCYSFLTGDLSQEMVTETRICIQTLSKHIRPKELYIISVEKLLGCTDMQLWDALLYALQLAMVGTNNIDTFNSGFVTVLKRGCQLCTLHIPSREYGDFDENDDDDDDNDEDGSESESLVKQQTRVQHVIDSMLVLCRGVIQMSTEWQQHTDESVCIAAADGHSNEVAGIIIGFLLNTAAKCVTQLSNCSHRQAFIGRITSLLLHVSNRFDDVLSHIVRERYRLFRAWKHSAVSDVVSGKKGAVSSEVSSDSLQQQPFSRYLTDMIRAGDVDGSSGGSLSTTDWSASVPWDHVTDDALDKISHTRVPSLHSTRKRGDSEDDVSGGGGGGGGFRSSDKYLPIDYYMYQSTNSGNKCPEVNRGLPVSSSLPWSITGIAMVAHYVLQSMYGGLTPHNSGDARHITPPLSSNAVHTQTQSTAVEAGHICNLPLVYSHSYIKALAERHTNVLVRHSALAVEEGLHLTCLLGTINKLLPVASSQMKLFTPRGAPLQSKEGVTRLIAQSYRRQQQPPESDSVKDVQISLVIHTILAADSTDTLSVLQSVISALASCSDNQVRNDAFTALRVMLKQYEERSLFSLLLRLIDQCPFISITGLLIDILKECAQAASLGKVWSNHQIYMPAVESADGSVSGKPVLCALGDVLTPSSLVLLQSARDEHTSDWDAFRSAVSLSDLKLRDYKTPSRNSGGGGGDLAPRGRRYEDTSEKDGVDGDMADRMIFSWGVGHSECDGSRETSSCSASPLWSPLLVRALLLPRLDEYAHFESADKLLEHVDVVGAVVNFVQFITMRLSAAMDVDRPAWSDDANGIGCFVAYFIVSGWSEESGEVANGCRSTATTALQDLIRMAQLVHALHLQVSDTLLPEFLTMSQHKLDLLRLQLLSSNISYVAERLDSLCFKILWVLLE